MKTDQALPKTGKRTKRPQKRVVSPRERLMSYFSWLMGGWNASPGIHAGRLAFEPNYADDEAMARMILETHKSHVTYELKQEVQKLKAELYDATKRANAPAHRCRTQNHETT